MLATASQTRSLVGSFYYDRALNQKIKGGHVVATNGIPQYASAAVQLAYMQAYCSEKYEVKAINIVLSHSSKDKELLAAHPERKNRYVNDFLDECKKNGIDLTNAAWIMMEHVNTDCDHYHMILLTTKFDGSRLDTGFIGKRAAKAAMAASKKNGLHFAEGLEKREQARLRHIAKASGELNISSTPVGLSSKDLEKLGKVSEENKSIKRRADARRAKSVEEANKRRNWVKETFERLAREASSLDDLSTSMYGEGITFGQDEKENYNATIMVGERQVTYKLGRLDANLSLIDEVKKREEADKKAKEMEKKKQEEKRKREEEQRRPGRSFHL